MKLFVYGTLKKGRGNQRLMGNDAQYIRNLDLMGYKLYGRGIPFMIETKNSDDKVRGEIWEVPDDVVYSSIDHLEGHPNWYRREEVTVVANDRVSAYVYRAFMNDKPEVHKNSEGVYEF